MTAHQVRRFLVLGIYGVLILSFTFGCLAFLYLTLIHPSVPIEAVRVSNLSENSLTLSWISYKPMKVRVYYSRYPIPATAKVILRVLPMGLVSRLFDLKVAGDDFGSMATTVHHVTFRDLEPETEYHYLISTGLRFYTQDNQGQPLPSLKTTALSETVPGPYPCYGKILDFAEETPEAPMLVYAFTENSSLVSAYTNSLGNYILDLGSLRVKDSEKLLDLNQNPIMVFEVQGGQWGEKTQPLYLDDCQPMATIVLE
ncbi:MAG: fibronectin type III domain-containing protein [Candidatus Marinimicrobia bacterium]|nr:fibronectin type III domain-containing protein [Candidatus Neomarinimicrobiota bacterium]